MFKKLYWPVTAWWGIITALWNDPEGELDNVVAIFFFVILTFSVVMYATLPFLTSLRSAHFTN